ncbi:MAG: hypothetical protein ABIQ02_09755 [Saprospiraceae bacterium]
MPTPYSTVRITLFCLANALLIMSAACSNGKYRSGEVSSSADQTSSVDSAKMNAEKNILLHVHRIAKKSKADVDAYLGSPSYHETITPSNAPCPCEKYIYKDGNLEVVFMSGKADWITVNHMYSVDYNSHAILEALAIHYAEPFMNNERVIKWNDFDGFDELSVFSDGKEKASYAFLKAITH